jgi:hypothetical protein
MPHTHSYTLRGMSATRWMNTTRARCLAFQHSLPELLRNVEGPYESGLVDAARTAHVAAENMSKSRVVVNARWLGEACAGVRAADRHARPPPFSSSARECVARNIYDRKIGDRQLNVDMACTSNSITKTQAGCDCRPRTWKNFYRSG